MHQTVMKLRLLPTCRTTTGYERNKGLICLFPIPQSVQYTQLCHVFARNVLEKVMSTSYSSILSPWQVLLYESYSVQLPKTLQAPHLSADLTPLSSIHH